MHHNKRSNVPPTNNHNHNSSYSYKNTRTSVYSNLQLKTQFCSHHKGLHNIFNCESFQVLSHENRLDRYRALNICRNSLREGHNTYACQSKSGCTICKKKHYIPFCTKNLPNHLLNHLQQFKKQDLTKQFHRKLMHACVQ